MFKPFFEHYVLGATVYGTARKAFQVRNAHYDQYDSDKNGYVKVPMLMSEKVLLCTFSGLVAPYALPVYLFLDMSEIEARYIRKNPSLYGYDTSKKYHFIDFMFK